MSRHLTDEEIQQYVADAMNGAREINDHISLCEECRSKAAAYRLLFAGIKKQEEPAFDFDLEKMVLAQLPQKTVFARRNLSLYPFIFSGIVLIGIALYVFRDYTTTLFAGIEALSIYLMVTTVIIILIAAGADMYKNFRKKMKLLDVY